MTVGQFVFLALLSTLIGYKAQTCQLKVGTVVASRLYSRVVMVLNATISEEECCAACAQHNCSVASYGLDTVLGEVYCRVFTGRVALRNITYDRNPPDKYTCTGIDRPEGCDNWVSYWEIKNTERTTRIW